VERSIYKYTLELTNTQSLAIPCGAEILTVQMQGVTPCIWALVDPNVLRVKRQFFMYGTGHPVRNDNLDLHSYVGSFQVNAGEEVYHLFEEKE